MSVSKHVARARQHDNDLRYAGIKPKGAEKHRRVLLSELVRVSAERDGWQRAYDDLAQHAHDEWLRAERYRLTLEEAILNGETR